MAHTLATGSEDQVLRANPSLSFQDGPYSYTIRQGVYTVTSGGQSISAPIPWGFGQGTAGQTFVFEHDGAWFESRVSYYADIRGLGLTLGARNIVPRNLQEAAGRQMSNADAAACFGCHSYGAVRESKFSVENIVPGVQCENCHAGAARHAAAVKAGDAKAAAMPHLSKLGAEEMSELCGRCHRTWSDIASNGPRGVLNVRFQGYRLTNSKCYDPSDTKISCVACHDPHREIERRSAAYDSKCTACHARSARARLCPTGKQDCASCHMPKYEIPGSHHRFSDHEIRVVRANATYPD
jgi:hypothetical protein